MRRRQAALHSVVLLVRIRRRLRLLASLRARVGPLLLRRLVIRLAVFLRRRFHRARRRLVHALRVSILHQRLHLAQSLRAASLRRHRLLVRRRQAALHSVVLLVLFRH